MATESTSAPCGAGAVGWAESEGADDDDFSELSSLSTLPNCLELGATGWVCAMLEVSADVVDGLLDVFG